MQRHEVTNTWFAKDWSRMVTWKPAGAAWAPPWDPSRKLDVLDYWLVPKRWNNTVMDCQSSPMANAWSDHCPLILKTKVKLAKMAESIQRKAKYRKTEGHERLTFAR